MNKYNFLITYLHEIAHLVHYEQKGNNNPPHGRIWKQLFMEIIQPVMNNEVFPADLLRQVRDHMKNPKASSYSDQKLAKAIKKYDSSRPTEDLLLEDIRTGEFFELHGKTFEKMGKKRTRALCLEIRTGRRYLISEMAVVKKN